jgi:hypothetical protein
MQHFLQNRITDGGEIVKNKKIMPNMFAGKIISLSSAAVSKPSFTICGGTGSGI